MSGIEAQAVLTLAPPSRAVDLATVRRCASMTRAIDLCVQLAGEKNDKPIYGDLEIDVATWSRIKTGAANFPHEKFEALMDRCGNDVPLLWLADRRGYELRRKLSAVEQELEGERARRFELERKLAYFEELMGKVVR